MQLCIVSFFASLLFPFRYPSLPFCPTIRRHVPSAPPLSALHRRPEKAKGRASEQGSEEETEGDLLFQRGDLLEVPRTLFTHFGIYLGGGYVAHLIPDILPMFSKDQGKIGQMVTNGRLILGVLVKCASVRVDSVEDFAYGSQILVNRMDQVCSRPPLGGEEVARRAEKLRGSVRYSLLWYNCEHYVMYCRYGTLVSFQTFQFCKTVRKMLLSRRVAKVTALLWASLLLYFRTVSACAVLPVWVPYTFGCQICSGVLDAQ